MGFTVLDEQHIDEVDGVVRYVQHEETGFEIFQIKNADKEALFSFCFRTVPENSRGVAHILEHSVLCGSKKYPVKDPFVQLAKGSMNTFLNAMTYPDRTLYPASSAVQADLLNIMRVYGDAVFFPLLRKSMFQQEGHHLRLEDGMLNIHGIVYNEMKGNYSSHDGVAMRHCLPSLFAHAPYAYDYGGAPDEIPNLSYEEFINFHKKFYHPSNALLFLYGDIDMEPFLEIVETEILPSFTRQDAHHHLLRNMEEPDKDKPLTLEVPYPSSSGQEKSSVSLNWRLFPVTDKKQLLSLAVLNELLIGNAAAPLYKALIESKLGESLTQFSGCETDLHWTLFSVGLEGSRREHAGAIEQCIMDTLRKIYSEGFTEKNIEATLRRAEIIYRELRSGHSASLSILGRIMRAWTYHSNPCEALKTNEVLVELKQTVKDNPAYLQQLIKPWFLDNTNRSQLTVYPDNDLQEKEAIAIKDKLKKQLSAMNDGDKQQIQDEAAALDQLQQQPDSPEDLASIPFLQRKDVPTEVEKLHWEKQELQQTPIVYTPLFSNDIVYLQCAFDVGDITDNELSLLPLFGSALTECGLEDMSPEDLASEISFRTGGIYCNIGCDAQMKNNMGHLRPMIFIQTKVLSHLFADACKILSRVLLQANFKHASRLQDSLLETQNGIISSVIPDGHHFLMMRGGRNISAQSRLEDCWHGIEQLFYLQNMQADSVADNLMQMRQKIFTADRLTISLTCSEKNYSAITQHVGSLIASLPSQGKDLRAQSGIQLMPDERIPAESLIVPASISHVGLILPAAPYSSHESAAERVLAHLMAADYLWQKIRMEGGAYGGFAVCRPREGIFSFISYRDPHLERSLTVFHQALEEYARKEQSMHDIDLALFSIIGNDLQSLSPQRQGDMNFNRYLHDISDDMRQIARDNLLKISPADVQKAAERLQAKIAEGSIAVMANEQKISEAVKDYPDLDNKKTVLPL